MPKLVEFGWISLDWTMILPDLTGFDLSLCISLVGSGGSDFGEGNLPLDLVASILGGRDLLPTNGSFELGKLQVGRSQFGGFWSSLDTPTSLAIMAKKMRRINKDEKKPLFLFSKLICLKCKR